MIIFDKPYVSDVIASYAQASQVPVLDNATARDLLPQYTLNLTSESDFARAVAQGGRLYTASENALDWVHAHIQDQALLGGIQKMKDKFALRNALKPMYPDYFFRQIPASRLRDAAFADLRPPFVLKPSIGFFSVGVYSILAEEDWHAALADIESNMQRWRDAYPGGVFGDADFLLEAFIKGEEYAVDVYFDENGHAVIVNIMKHDFTSDKDVSDRLYYTSAEIVREKLLPFTQYFDRMNRYVRVKNYPAHIEIRITDDGTILPIECNPMRFSGWCTTDVAYHAFGVRTYAYYLENQKPDWEKLLQGKEKRIYSMIILDKPSGVCLEGTRFDYAALCADFSKVLNLRRMEKPEYPMFGFVFAETPEDKRHELDRIMRSNLEEYIVAVQ